MKRFTAAASATLAVIALCALVIVAGCTPQGGGGQVSRTSAKSAFEVSDTGVSSSSSTALGGSPSAGATTGSASTNEAAGTGTASSSSSASAANQPGNAGGSTSSAASAASAEQNASPASSGKDSAAEAKLAEATNNAASIADASNMQVGVAIVDLPSGLRNGYRADEQMVSASMIKLVIAYTFLEQVAAGAHSLDEYYVLQAEDIVGGTGVLGALGAGAQVSYRDLLNKMISASDNTATNVLINTVSMAAVNDTARKLELSATELNRYMMDSDAIANGIENMTSANDVAALLQMAYEKTFVSPEYSTIVMEALEQQQDFGGIQGGLPEGVMFAHKTGTLGTVRHDGGIVECEHPFILVTLCGGEGFYEQGALDTMAEIGGATYRTLV